MTSKDYDAHDLDVVGLLHILPKLYGARSSELNSKGLLSYLLWALFILVSTWIYTLHYKESVGATSVYAAIYPYFLLGWLGAIVYIQYKIKLLWIYLERLEVAFCELILKTPLPRQDWNADAAPKIKYPIPLWAVAQRHRIKWIGFYEYEFAWRLLETSLLFLCSSVWALTTYKGWIFIVNYSNFKFPVLSASVYALSLLVGYLAVLAIYRSFRKRLARVEQEKLFGF